MHKRGYCRHAVSVRLSVCYVRELRQNEKRAKRDGANPTGIPLTGASNARGYEKMTIFDQYLALSEKRL